MGTSPKFSGAQIQREPRYEAHLFILISSSDREAVRQLAHSHGFRLSSRPRVSRDGRLDLLITKNGNDRGIMEADLRHIADDCLRVGYEAYRIRLEEMIFDEVTKASKAQQ